MQKKKKPLVLKADRLKVLTTTDLQQVDGGTGIPPKLMTYVIRELGR
jgi:bacteriocin-like protein